MGFESDLFVSQIDENLICTICHEIFKDPVSCKDGHTFCSECMYKWLDTHTFCPLDRRRIGKKCLMRNLTVRGIVENLLVHCVHWSQEGTSTARPTKKQPKLANESKSGTCPWVGKLQELDEHGKLCPFQVVDCPHKRCTDMIFKKDLEEHIKKCKMRNVECEWCGSAIPLLDLEQHRTQECPLGLIPCINKCPTSVGQVTMIPRMYMTDHLMSECDKQIVACPFSENGCQVQVCRSDVDKHMDENMKEHLMLLAKQNTELKQQLERANANIKFQVSSLRTDLSNSYIWTIHNFPQLFHCSRSRTGYSSPVFWLCGCSWRMKMFPKGSTASDEGFLALYLDREESTQPTYPFKQSVIYNSKVSVLFRFSVLSNNGDVPEHSMSSDEPFSFTSNDQEWGFENFMRVGMTLSPNYCDHGNLRLKCMMQLSP